MITIERLESFMRSKNSACALRSLLQVEEFLPD